MDDQLQADVASRFKKDGITINAFSRLAGGANNQIYRLDSTNNQRFILKVYFADRFHRLAREYGALQLFRQNGINSVPRCVFKNDDLGYAVYSFEEGSLKTDQEMNRGDLSELVDFIVNIQKLTPPLKDFENAITFSFSFSDYEDLVMTRLTAFLDSLNTAEINPRLKEFNDEVRAEELIKKKLKNIKDQLLKTNLPNEISSTDYRLSPEDVGPHNMLFNDGKKPIFIDFECFGWDDPTRLIAVFLHHERSKHLSQEDKKYFLDTYYSSTSLPKRVTDRLIWSMKYIELDWIATLLQSMTPGKIKKRSFSLPDFDKEKYVEEQINKIRDRLAQLNNAQ